MVTHVVIYPDAAEKVTNTAECRSFLARIASAAKEDAYAAAPVRSGNYQESLFASALPGKDPMAQLASSSSFWHFVEYGALETPPYRVLNNAIAHHVDRYEETGG